MDREYGVGRGRIDLLVRWPYTEVGQRHDLERLSLDEGVLVIFDRRREAGDAESRTRFEQAKTPSGRKVTVLRA